MYPYITFLDGTEVVHSHVIQEGEMKRVEVHFERPIYNGFDTARCSLPDYKWLIRDGFSDKEMATFEEFLRSNAHLIFRYAENAGILGDDFKASDFSLGSTLQSLIPISKFNQGGAAKIFEEVRTTGFGIVVKNDTPECVLVSPEKYQEMEEIIENYYLLQLAEK